MIHRTKNIFIHYRLLGSTSSLFVQPISILKGIIRCLHRRGRRRIIFVYLSTEPEQEQEQEAAYLYVKAQICGFLVCVLMYPMDPVLAIPGTNLDENGPCEYPSKNQENCKQNGVAKLGGTVIHRTSGDHSHNLCNPPAEPTNHGYSYKLVDDFIFSDRSLIGKFTRLRPSILELSEWSKSNWAPKLRSIWVFKIMREGFFKIEFFSQEDCEFVLENGPWFMAVAGLTLKRWSPDFDPQNPGPLKTPVWMSLHGLPLEFWNEESLIKICSKVGKVLQIAETTAKMNGDSTAARVCVEVDIREGLMPTIDLHFSGVRVTQELDYEGMPFRCKLCRSAEHLEGSCPSKSTKTLREKV